MTPLAYSGSTVSALPVNSGSDGHSTRVARGGAVAVCGLNRLSDRRCSEEFLRPACLELGSARIGCLLQSMMQRAQGIR